MDRYIARVRYLSFVLFSFVLSSQAQPITEAWVRYDANGYPYGSMIAIDSDDNVVVTGWRWLIEQYIVTKKYDPDGNLLWERHYSVPDLEAVSTWILVDAFDNVIITGYPRTITSNPVEVGLLTIKYDSAGNLLWSDVYDGTWAFAVRAAADVDGNIYVAGRAWFGSYDFVTIKYAPDGNRLWVDTFDQNSGFHTPTAMDLDSQGNLVITGGGMSGGLITTLYDTDGNRQWVAEHVGAAGSSVKLDDGFIYLTGSLYNVATSNDLLLLKYDLNGNIALERTYDFGVTSEFGRKLVLDSGGNIIVTGIQGIYTNWLTIKTNPQGTMLWSQVYNAHPANDEYPDFMIAGPDDEVYISGTGGPPPSPCCSYRSMVTLRYDADGSTAWWDTLYATSQRGVGIALGSDRSVYVAGDYMLTTVKYVQEGSVGAIPCEDVFFFNAKCNANGAAQAMVKVRGDYGGETVTLELDGNPHVVTLQSNGTSSIGKLQVRPAGVGSHTVELVDPPGCYAPVTFNCQVASLSDAAQLEIGEEVFEQETKSTGLLGNYPNPFNPSTTISYQLAAQTHVKLAVSDMLGRDVVLLVDGVKGAGNHSVEFNGKNLASGLYFYRLEAGGLIETKRLVLLK